MAIFPDRLFLIVMNQSGVSWLQTECENHKIKWGFFRTFAGPLFTSGFSKFTACSRDFSKNGRWVACGFS